MHEEARILGQESQYISVAFLPSSNRVMSPSESPSPSQAEIDAKREELLILLDKARDQRVDSRPPVPDGEEIDWRQRKWELRTAFREHGVLDIADGVFKNDQLTTADGKLAFDRQQCKIMRMIGAAIPKHRLQQIDHLDTGTEMWQAICEIYERRMDPVIRESIIVQKSEELRNMKCSNSTDISIHLSKMFSIRTELASYKYEVNPISMKQMMLDSLPDQYEFEQLRAGVKYGGSGAGLTPETLRALIEQAAERQSARRRKGNGNQRPQHQKNGGSRGQQEDRNGQQREGQAKPKKRCHRCGKIGHIAANCRTIIDGTPGPGVSGNNGGNANGSTPQQRSNFTSAEAVSICGEPGVSAGVMAELVESDVEKKIGPNKSWWCFDTGSNIHLVGDKSALVSIEDIDPESLGARIQGVAANMLAQASGIGTVKLVTQVKGQEFELFIDDVLYVEGAEHGLFSMDRALEQGFEIDYDKITRTFSVFKDDIEIIHATKEQGIWIFAAKSAVVSEPAVDTERIIVNYTVADGVATLQQWHERTMHTCHRYLKMMVDRGLVKGMMITHRQPRPCDACHLGKEKQKRRKKKHVREVTAPNQVVYADLMFPPKDNGTEFMAVLVIMDAWSRYLTIHLLKDKSSATVNPLIQQYIVWAERQAGRGVQTVIEREFEPIRAVKFPVQRVFTDKGGEFMSNAMADWYAARGIEHIKVGPKSSHLNPCERAHQTIVGMMKCQMRTAGFPRSFWKYLLLSAVYVKNRIYSKAIDGIPYERMFQYKPDVHHLRKPGALVYIHVPDTPERTKEDDNAIIGYLLGYREDDVGCLVYIPSHNVVKFASEVRVQEDVMYGDRHRLDAEDREVGDWLTFTTKPPEENEQDQDENENEDREPSNGDVDGDVQDEASNAGNMIDQDMDEPDDDDARDHDMDEPDDGASEINASASFEASMVASRRSTSQENSSKRSSESQENSNTRSSAGQESPDQEDQDESDDDQVDAADDSSSTGDSDSVSANQGSVAGSDDQDGDLGADAESAEAGSAAATAEEEAEHSEQSEHSSDAKTTSHSEKSAASTAGEDEAQAMELDLMDETSVRARDLTDLLVAPRKRVTRDQTPSEEERNQLGGKVRRTGLRERMKLRPPSRYSEYIKWANVTLRVVGKNGKAIRSSNLKVPKNRRQAMRSKHADLWRIAEMEEMAALKAKGVLEEIEGSEMPESARAIRTMWVYALKTDAQGFVVRFKARLVALGNWQRPGIDFNETFAPVARMSSFRLLVAISAELGLKLYGGDINTAYLNATLHIPQYVRSIEGFACNDADHVYIVRKALYGLRQSGREWNSEMNGWLLSQGFQRCATEPCLYYRTDGEKLILLLVYVDDVICATNDENSKCDLFERLNKEYGLKDQGLLTDYLGVEIQQSEESVFIAQRKYANDILEKFGYVGANKCGNPMETNAHLTPATDEESVDVSFDYRGALGSLMYLATGTRPDLAYALGQLSRFVSKPTMKHVGALKRVLRYLIGTVDYGIMFKKNQSSLKNVIQLQGYCDSDWGADPETRKSTTGFVFTIGGGAISWMSKRQSITAQSTAEAEYVASCEESMEARAQSNILTEILPKQACVPVIGIDNSAALVMATNPTYSRRTRHIELRWHYVRD